MGDSKHEIGKAIKKTAEYGSTHIYLKKKSYCKKMRHNLNHVSSLKE